jgi:hypothetical protein
MSRLRRRIGRAEESRALYPSPGLPKLGFASPRQTALPLKGGGEQA